MNDADKAGLDRPNTYGEGLEESGIFDREGAGEVPVAQRALRSWGIESDYLVLSQLTMNPMFVPLPPSWNTFDAHFLAFIPAEGVEGTATYTTGIAQFPLESNTFEFVDGALIQAWSTDFELSTDHTLEGQFVQNGVAGPVGHAPGGKFLIAEDIEVIDNALVQIIGTISDYGDFDGDERPVVLCVVLTKKS